VPGPRGGQWNASTVRGDPKKTTGILNNPLYVGRLVWGRRQWRRNPDSEKRERRYRLRAHAEWIEVAVPDLRIVDDAQ
jgi:site-specific DNA recombinase